MEYQKRSINGDAGEYFVAYTVTKLFGWPCRLYGVDLGVDAELEIMDNESRSTGDVIKIQIKSFDRISNNDSKSIYADDRHIAYWKKFCLPVIICCVDLSVEKIYWKQITATESYSSGGESQKISFDLSKDLLDKNSESALRTLVTPEESKQIEQLFKLLYTQYKKLPSPTFVYTDYDMIDRTRNHCDEMQKLINQIDRLIAYFPWKVSTLDLRNLSIVKRNIQTTLIECNYYYCGIVNGG